MQFSGLRAIRQTGHKEFILIALYLALSPWTVESPQGSCLGHLLFYTNDMPHELSKDKLTLADDSTVYYAAPTCSELNQVLRCEISILLIS